MDPSEKLILRKTTFLESKKKQAILQCPKVPGQVKGPCLKQTHPNPREEPQQVSWGLGHVRWLVSAGLSAPGEAERGERVREVRPSFDSQTDTEASVCLRLCSRGRGSSLRGMNSSAPGAVCPGAGARGECGPRAGKYEPGVGLGGRALAKISQGPDPRSRGLIWSEGIKVLGEAHG